MAGILVLPLVLPPTVLGYYLLQILGRRALAGALAGADAGDHDRLPLVGGGGGLGGGGVSAVPAAGAGAFEAVDPALEDVARLLGRSELSVFFAVTLPLAWRGLAAGIVLAFARALGDFGATLMVAGNIPGLTQTAALAIYDAVQVNDAARAGWLTLWISLVSIVALGGRPAQPAGARARAVSASDREVLDVRLIHRVHPALLLDVALRLGREIGVVFGPSGAGKTTLLRLIAGLATPHAGHVRLEGEALFDAAQRINQPLRRRRIGMIFQDDCLFPHLSVAANIRFGLKGWTR